jgi:predicted GNAT superfamily acetyltransferase
MAMAVRNTVRDNGLGQGLGPTVAGQTVSKHGGQGMSIAIRDVREHELDSVLALNNAAGPAILPLDAARLRRLHNEAEYFRVAERDGALAGFLIGFGSGARHDSDNFRWFGERHPQFFYIDRIAVASRRRGGGVGRAFYADVQSYAELRYPQLACEVFLEHDSDPALLFHGSFGFREIGQHVMAANSANGAPGRRAAMLMKELCSYPWVHDTYGDHLPDVPWIATSRDPASSTKQLATGS